MEYISHSLKETSDIVAAHFLPLLHGQRDSALVVGLYGDLGSGKTAFTQVVAQILGIREIVTSPTFVIEKIYTIEKEISKEIPTGFTHLIHIDAYRLDRSEELISLGWKDITSNPTNLILIEWPERVADIMPANHMRISCTFVDETTRKIVFNEDSATSLSQ